ncbi:MAG: tetratricopeptide repeat protein [Anaerolineae bacterium]|nr:tetratricopeptide repeat protein [Anaerolineae bacterium]
MIGNQEQLRGERRDVAVMFVDAVDFTRLSLSLDAELVFNMVSDLLSRLAACVERYDGLVDKFTGDGLMAVFGAPIAHENDAELAIRAALDMLQAAADFAPLARAKLGAVSQVRIGIHYGPSIAGVLSTQQQSAYTVIGDTVNLAARLEALAAPGHILVSAAVHDQARAVFEFAPGRELPVKGVDAPMEVFELASPRGVPGALRGMPGMAGVFLGREDELSGLSQLLATFVEDRRGRLVAVTGEAGLGKSRLVQEWIAAGAPSPITVWRGRGLPYAQGTGYGVFRSLLQDGIEGYASPDAWRAQVSESLRPFISRVLGLPGATQEDVAWEHLPPERISQLTTLAIKEWLSNEARRQPLVLVLDDFHWADDLSQAMLESLLSQVTEVPVLFCVMARPDPKIALDLVALAAPDGHCVALAPLSDGHSRELLSTMVNLDGFPESTIEAILARAEGNPFYIEEFVRMLIEQELVELHDGRWRAVSAAALEGLEFPTSLRGLMLARIDRLPENLRHLLQDAAVVGLQFDAALLQAVEYRLRRVETINPMLERLEELDLLERRPLAGSHAFAFRHILTQETVYRSILRNERPDLHRVVAESIETLYAEDLAPHTEILALHYDRSRQREKALTYTLRAGTRAQHRFANREALGYYSRALQLSQHIDDSASSRWQAAVGLGDVQQHIGEYEDAISFYTAALDEQPLASSTSRADVMLKMGRAWDKLGDREKSEEWLRMAATEIERSREKAPATEAEIYNALGWLTLRGGDLPAAEALLTRAVTLVDNTDNYEVLASILNRLGAVHFSQGEWQRAVDVVQRSLDIRERLGDILGVARSSNNLGILQRDNGDWQGALRTYQRCLEAMRTIGDTEGEAMALTNAGGVYVDLGEWDMAETSLRRSYEIAQKIANPYERAQANMNLGRLFLMKGELDRAEGYMDTAISQYAQVGVSANPNVIDAYWLRGMLHLEQGEIEQADDWSRRNHSVLKEGTGVEDGDSPEWGRYHQLVGRLALVRGQVDEAIRHFDRAKSIFQANRSPAEIGRTAYWSAQAWLRANGVVTAREHLSEAVEIFKRLGARADLSRAAQFLAGLDKAAL